MIPMHRAKAAVGGLLDEEKLRKVDMRRSLLLLIGIPYIRAKAQDYFEQLGGGVDADFVDDDTSRPPRRTLTVGGHLRRFYKITYPYANTAFELWQLGYNLAYLFDRTPFYRPWLAWIRVDLQRLGPEDYRAASANGQTSAAPPPPGLLPLLRRLIFSSPRLLLDSLSYLLPLSIFFIKFLEWWYSPASPARSLSTSKAAPNVPPPKILLPHPRGVPMDDLVYGQCPICRDAISNATALPTGYVCCYRCAHKQVEDHGRCPVTLLPVKVWQLRKILV